MSDFHADSLTSAPSADASPPDDAPARPATPRALFMACTALSLQGFGGVMAIVQRELVERHRWYTPAQFVEEWAVAQILPGPNSLNLTMALGERYFGWRGALAAVAGMLLAPMLALLAMAVLYARLADLPAVQGALRGMGAVAAGLITATGLKLVPALRTNAMGQMACAVVGAATFVAVVVLHLPLLGILLTVGCSAWGWAWWRLWRTAQARRSASSGAQP
ncbi:MAG: chromate transporter [Brachymonas sp.]|uniref:chromate transporter n=1 Tax=unclassified Brachymonas TaxID=2621329 RepID=UPI0035B0D2E6